MKLRLVSTETHCYTGFVSVVVFSFSCFPLQLLHILLSALDPWDSFAVYNKLAKNISYLSILSILLMNFLPGFFAPSFPLGALYRKI